MQDYLTIFHAILKMCGIFLACFMPFIAVSIIARIFFGKYILSGIYNKIKEGLS